MRVFIKHMFNMFIWWAKFYILLISLLGEKVFHAWIVTLFDEKSRMDGDANNP